jgi:hypothetical protein
MKIYNGWMYCTWEVGRADGATCEERETHWGGSESRGPPDHPTTRPLPPLFQALGHSPPRLSHGPSRLGQGGKKETSRKQTTTTPRKLCQCSAVQMRSSTELEHRSECETASPEIQHKSVWPNEERNVCMMWRGEGERTTGNQISLSQQPSTGPDNKRNNPLSTLLDL